MSDPSAFRAKFLPKEAIWKQANASALVIAHNHPSGVPEPSEADRLLTKDILTAARPLGVRVLDHVIVAEDAVFSFADSGLMDELAIEAGAV
jgi:DNA repair protein RadC